MRLLIDEDVVVGVGRLLASDYDVEYIREVFGPSTKDPEVVRYATATSRILVTADRPLANRLRQTRAAPCLFCETSDPRRRRGRPSFSQLSLSRRDCWVRGSGWKSPATTTGLDDRFHANRDRFARVTG